MIRKFIEIGDWRIDLSVDEDNHLTVGINNSDDSPVHALDADISRNGKEWSERFTTKEIEIRHIDNCELGDNWKQCPACVDHHNSNCREKEKLPIPQEIL